MAPSCLRVVIVLVFTTVASAAVCQEKKLIGSGYTYKDCGFQSCCGSDYIKYCCDGDWPTTWRPDVSYAVSAALSTAAIIGIVVGVLILVAIIVSIIVCCVCCMRSSQGSRGHVMQPSQPHVTVATTSQGQTNVAYSPGQSYPAQPHQMPMSNYPAYPPTNYPAHPYPPTPGSGVDAMTDMAAPPPAYDSVNKNLQVSVKE